MSAAQSMVLSGIITFLLASCGNDGGSSTQADSFAPFSQRLNQEQGFAQDSEGNWVARSDRRSEFDGRDASDLMRGSSTTGRRINTNEFEPAEWTRKSSNRPQAYSGQIDDSKFQTTAAAQGQVARQSGERSGIEGTYRTGNYRTGASRENSGRRIPHTQDAQTENRRNSIPPPVIVDWREQRKLSIEQSRSMLSR